MAVIPAEGQARALSEEAQPLRCPVRAVDPARDLALLAAGTSTRVSSEQHRNRLKDCLAVDEIIETAIEST